MKIPIMIKLDEYSQYDINDLKDKKIFNLLNKSFFQTKKSIIQKELLKNTHYRLLALMIFLHEASDAGILNNIRLYNNINYKKNAVNNFWTAFFDYEINKKEAPLILACQKILDLVDDDLLVFWEMCKKKNLISYMYDEKNINQFINECTYIQTDTNILGKVIYPNKIARRINQVKHMVIPIWQVGLGFIAKNKNSVQDYKEKDENLKKESISLLQNFSSFLEEEKLSYAEMFLMKNCYYKQAGDLIENIKSVYFLNQKHRLNDPMLEHEYDRLINSSLIQLLQFVDIYKNEKQESILEHILMMNELTLKIKNNFNQQIEHEVKIRVLKEKKKNI